MFLTAVSCITNEPCASFRSCSDGVYNVELFNWMDGDRVVDNQLSINERLVHEGLASGLTAHKVVEPQHSVKFSSIDQGWCSCQFHDSALL